LTDFGVAAASPEHARMAQSLMGGFEYMAPELLEYGRVSRQSDIFSLGVVLYELFTGVQPFRRPAVPATIRAVMSHVPESLHHVNEQIPVNISQAVMTALEKKPESRYQESMELLFLLKHAAKKKRLVDMSETMDERIRYMRALRFFRDFSENDLQEVLGVGTWYHFRRGAPIVKEDEANNDFYIVILGQVHVQRNGDIIAMIDRGSCFGEMAAFSRQRRTATIVAARDCVVLRIDGNTIPQLSKDLQILFYRQILKTLVSRLEAAGERARYHAGTSNGKPGDGSNSSVHNDTSHSVSSA
jgi:hypothetical protein